MAVRLAQIREGQLSRLTDVTAGLFCRTSAAVHLCEAYADAERAGRVARPEEDRGEFAESYAQSLWRIGKAEGWLV